jgi:hypothetical protein
MQQSGTRNEGDKPRPESTQPPRPEAVTPTLDPKAVCASMKGFGPNALAEVLFRAFLAEHDGRRVLVRLWLEVYRQLVEEEWPRKDGEKSE